MKLSTGLAWTLNTSFYQIEAESETEAIKEFKSMHPHKKFRLLDPLDD